MENESLIGSTGYEIRYSLKKNFRNVKIVTLNNKGKHSLKIKKLKAAKKYYYRSGNISLRKERYYIPSGPQRKR